MIELPDYAGRGRWRPRRSPAAERQQDDGRDGENDGSTRTVISRGGREDYQSWFKGRDRLQLWTGRTRRSQYRWEFAVPR